MRILKPRNHKMTQWKEISLKGGRTTPGIIKIDNTVHRPQASNAKIVHALLLHLENIHFNGAPRFLGIDDQNREMLTYIDGDVPTELGIWSDKVLASAAQLIRHYHDATIKSRFADHGEVFCHYDLSPCNTVFKNGSPIAFIDFDAASPGKKIDDVAYAIWLWCDLGNPELSVIEQSRRIQLFYTSYGLSDTKSAIIDAIIEAQKKQIKKYQANVNNGLPGWEKAIAWAENALKWVTINKAILENEL